MHVGQKDRVLMLMYASNLLKQKVQMNTGLQSVGSLNALCSIIEPKAENMRYWEVSKRSLKSRSKKLKCNCKAVHSTPIKPGLFCDGTRRYGVPAPFFPK